MEKESVQITGVVEQATVEKRKEKEAKGDCLIAVPFVPRRKNPPSAPAQWSLKRSKKRAEFGGHSICDCSLRVVREKERFNGQKPRPVLRKGATRQTGKKGKGVMGPRWRGEERGERLAAFLGDWEEKGYREKAEEKTKHGSWTRLTSLS